MEPAANPEPYREPRAGVGALRRKRAWRAVAGGAALVLLVVLVDASLVRRSSSPACRTCGSWFNERKCSIDIPFTGIATEISTTTTLQHASRASEFIATAHTHRLSGGGFSETRGFVLCYVWSRTLGCGRSAATPFAAELNAQPTFADFVRDAVARGDVTSEQVAAAIEIDLEDAGPDFEDPRDATPDERRIIDIANALHAAWSGRPAAETDLWRERD